MKRFYTTIKQSEDLVTIGLPLNTANMTYEWIYPPGKWNTTPVSIEALEIVDPYNVPCWNVTALKGLIPMQLKINDIAYDFYDFYNDGRWEYCYIHSALRKDDSLFVGETEIDCAYNMIMWLIKNNYLQIK